MFFFRSKCILICLDGIACLLILILRCFFWTEMHVNTVFEYFTLQITEQFNRHIHTFFYLIQLSYAYVFYCFALSSYLLILFISHLWECNGSFFFYFFFREMAFAEFFLNAFDHVIRHRQEFKKQRNSLLHLLLKILLQR